MTFTSKPQEAARKEEKKKEEENYKLFQTKQETRFNMAEQTLTVTQEKSPALLLGERILQSSGLANGDTVVISSRETQCHGLVCQVVQACATSKCGLWNKLCSLLGFANGKHPQTIEISKIDCHCVTAQCVRISSERLPSSATALQVIKKELQRIRVLSSSVCTLRYLQRNLLVQMEVVDPSPIDNQVFIVTNSTRFEYQMKKNTQERQDEWEFASDYGEQVKLELQSIMAAQQIQSSLLPLPQV